MEPFCKLGDTIGYIRKSQKYGSDTWTWELVDSKVSRMSIGKRGVRVYANHFSPFDDEELRSNTQFMQERNSLILVHEPFVLDDELRERCERWVAWINEDPENEKKASALSFGGDE